MSCTKCVLLSPSTRLALAFEENEGRNAAGGREEEGAAEAEGGVLSSGILLGWNIFAARSVSTSDVNTS